MFCVIQEIETRKPDKSGYSKYLEAYYCSIKIKGQDNFFSVSTETSREVALTNIGDTISIKFIKVGDGQYIITNSFENLTLKNQSEDSKKLEEEVSISDDKAITEEDTTDIN